MKKEKDNNIFLEEEKEREKERVLRILAHLHLFLIAFM
jgi:hypothetical protein